MNTAQQQKLFDALRQITARFPAAKLRRTAEQYGLTPDEAVDMVYDEMRDIAKAALRGVKRPTGDAQ